VGLLKQNRKKEKGMNEQHNKIVESVMLSLIMPDKMKKTEVLITHFRFFNTIILGSF